MKLKVYGRLAFPAVFEPEAIGDGEPAYGSRLIIDPADKKQVAEIDAAIEEVAKAKWPGNNNKGEPKWKAILEQARKDGNVCFSKDDYCNKDGDVYDGFEGNYHLACRSQVQPKIRDTDGKTDLTKRDGRPYSGCHVMQVIEIWAQDNAFGRGVRAQLTGIQFVRDGDAFAGGTVASDDDFDDLSNVGQDEDESEFA